MIRQIGQPATEPHFEIEVVTDPVECARAQAQHARGCRNMHWLEANWDKVLPQAFGKFVAVAGQEAFIADTVAEARAKARAAHPEDDGALVQYVRPDRGPRIYACRW